MSSGTVYRAAKDGMLAVRTGEDAYAVFELRGDRPAEDARPRFGDDIEWPRDRSVQMTIRNVSREVSYTALAQDFGLSLDAVKRTGFFRIGEE